MEFELTRPVEFAVSLRVLEFEDEDDDEYEDEAIGALPHTRPPLGERGPRIIGGRSSSVNEQSLVLHRPWTDY